MHVVIHHSVNDPAKWGAACQKMMSMMEQGKIPAGLKPLEFLPSVDGRRADCVWEADSIEAVKQFIDRETGSAARNEYFEVKTDQAMGLPKGEERMQHA